jgi:NADH:ubiquinone oxidoreductase subunit H
MNSHKNMKKQMRTMFLGGYKKPLETVMVSEMFIILKIKPKMVLKIKI